MSEGDKWPLRRAYPSGGWPSEPCACPRGGPYAVDCVDHGIVVWCRDETQAWAQAWDEARAKAGQP